MSADGVSVLVASRIVHHTDCTRTIVANFPFALPLQHQQFGDTSDRVVAVRMASYLRLTALW
jgi:hypothetical protein